MVVWKEKSFSCIRTIFNIDSFYNSFSYPDWLEDHHTDGYLEVFEREGDQWSFVAPAKKSSSEFSVEEVAEKRRISPLCSTGLYYFRSVSLFIELFEKSQLTDVRYLDGQERYVAPLYNLAIQRVLKLDFIKSAIKILNVLALGRIPQCYKAYSHVACLSGQLQAIVFSGKFLK